jgi:hypothetical protein
MTEVEKRTAEIELWALIDDDGSYVVGTDERTRAEHWGDEIGGTPLNSRTLKLMLAVPLPQGVEVSAALPDLVESKMKLKLTMVN